MSISWKCGEGDSPLSCCVATREKRNFALARVVGVPWWRRALAWWRKPCRFGCGSRLRHFSTSEGSGGRCERCGRIAGWMTSVELQQLAPELRCEIHSDEILADARRA
jgi:hypothetical protein